MADDRIVSANKMAFDEEETFLRPKLLKDFTGQEKFKEELEIYIKAALKRGESLDHVLLYGPPGLGKTTLASIISNELGTNIRYISGPSIERSGDLASILTDLEPGDVLFIDEIHRIPRNIEEVLYSAMEDYVLDIVVGKDGASHSIRVDLPPFTLIGATTRFGDLSSPLRDRFGIIARLEYYTPEELHKIVLRTASVYETKIEDVAAYELARRSRGTPRIANRLFRRVRDFADVLGDGTITLDICRHSLDKLKVDGSGLDSTDYRYLRAIVINFNGGPVGLDTLSATISEDPTTIEDVYEPYLLQEGYIKRTPRGRVATKKSYDLFGKKYYEGFLD